MKLYEANKIVNEINSLQGQHPTQNMLRRGVPAAQLKAPKAPEKPGILSKAASALSYNPIRDAIGKAAGAVNKYAGDPLGTLSKNIKRDAGNAKDAVVRKASDAKEAVLSNTIDRVGKPLNNMLNRSAINKEAERGRTIDAQRAQLDAQVARKNKAKAETQKAQSRPPQQPQPIQPQPTMAYRQPQQSPVVQQPVRPRPQTPTMAPWANTNPRPVAPPQQYGVQPGQRFKRTM